MTTRWVRWLGVAAAVLAGSVGPVLAQTPSADVVTPPANVLLPNYNSVPIGPNAGLEGSAHVARVGDPSAAWLNPAGLSRSEQAEISGSSGSFQLATVSPSSLPDSGGSITQVPSLVGFTVANVGRKGMTAGISFLTPNSLSQQTDSQLVLQRDAERERFAYSADSTYEQHVGVGSVGWKMGKLRAGGGLAFVLTNITRNGVVSDRLSGATSLRTFLLESRLTASAFQLRPLFGVQYDLSPHLAVGGTIRTRPITMHSSAVTTSDGIAENGAASVGASYFDAGAEFTNKLPFEFHGGIAYTGARGDVEVDVQGYTAISTYTMIASDQPIVTYGNAGPGSLPTVTTRPFDGFASQMRGIANVSAGGRFLLTSNGVWRLHWGVGTDLSPVGDEDRVFTKVDMITWSAGLSGTKGPLQFAAGVSYRTGTADDVIVRDLQNGTQVKSSLDIRTIGLIYSLSYKF